MKKIIFTILLLMLSVPSLSHAHDKESVYDRIMKENKLRCGYAIATPWFMKDSETEKLSGYGYDVTEALAQKSGLEIEWVEETGWGVAEQGIITGRYDMLCGTVCVDPRRARAVTYSTPFKHAPMLAAVRVDDTRFNDGDLSKINHPDVKIGVKSGHVFEFLANENFPKAEKVYANDISDDTEFFLMLSSNKIDIAFTGQITADLYSETNPDKIRTLGNAVRYCNGAYMMPLGEHRLKYLIDNALMELNTSGQLEKIMSKYMPIDPRYIRLPAMPFRELEK